MSPSPPGKKIHIPSPTPSSVLSPELKRKLNTALLDSGGVKRIQTHLRQEFQRAGWADAVRRLCLEIQAEEAASTAPAGKSCGPALTEEELLRTVKAEVRRKGSEVAVPAKVVESTSEVLREALKDVVVVGWKWR